MIYTSVLVLLGLGFTAAALLAAASRVLYVKEDPRIAAVEDALVGANCGGCGYPGCAAAAAAVVAGKAPANVCVAGGMENAEAVARVMGWDVGYCEPRLARPDCTGGSRAVELFAYEGAADCRAQAMLHGGGKLCPEGCLGLGTCMRACPFGAITMGDDGLPRVNPDKCRACGKCVEACPRGVMEVTGLSAHLLHLNREGDCLAPCRQKCPAQIDIPRYIERIRMGDFEGAVGVIKERNPLLLVCGRVCPHPCETVCRRGTQDEPVAINYLKRYVADIEMNSGRRYPVSRLPDTGRKVAVVGGGPSGLSCAYFLRRVGHAPTIFESMPKLGGQMRYGIPEYRLPKKVLDWEIQGILDLGVEARTEVRFGRDVTLSDLKAQGFEAVYMAIGAWTSSTLRIEGEDLPGVMAGTEFLTNVGLGLAMDTGNRVVVVGGGNTAIDAARTAVRLGAGKVAVMYRRTEKEMPANKIEVKAAKEEGVEFLFLAAPARAVPDESERRASGVEYVSMRLGEPDASGRRRPEPVEGSEQIVQADTIIAAIGQKPDLECLYENGTCSLDATRWRTLEADPETLATSVPGVFAGGDAYHGPALVVTAVGDGRRAARSIHHYLLEESGTVPGDLKGDTLDYTLFKDVDGIEEKARAECPELCVEDRACSFAEVELAISAEDARRESCRCLNCGLICYNPDQEKTAPTAPPVPPREAL